MRSRTRRPPAPWVLVVLFALLSGGCGRSDPGDPASDGASRVGADDAQTTRATAPSGLRTDDSPDPPAADDGGFPLRIEDAAGRQHVLESPPRRIVALVPSANQTLHELGVTDRLVGRTDWDTARAFRHLPSVGGGLRPSLERIVTLDPDLVIRFQGESDQVTPAHLDEVGIRHFAIRPERIADIRTIIDQLGRIVGRPGRADELRRHMEREFGKILETVGNEPRPSVVYLLGGTPPMVAGPDTFIEELVELAGGTNAFHDLDARYSPVSREELVARDIDVVLHPARIAPEVQVPGARFEEVSPLVETPGPYLVEAAWELARTLHPRAFR